MASLKNTTVTGTLDVSGYTAVLTPVLTDMSNKAVTSAFFLDVFVKDRGVFTSGASILSFININTITTYVCLDNTKGVAVWSSASVGESSVSITETPVITCPASITENTEFQITIANYDPNNIYVINTSGGEWTAYSNIITWLTPSVKYDSNGYITVQSTSPGLNPSKVAIKNIMILDNSSIADSAIIYEDATMLELTGLTNTSIVNNVLIAGDASELAISNNVVYGDIYTGDTVTLNDNDFTVLTTESHTLPAGGITGIDLTYTQIVSSEDARKMLFNPDGTKLFILKYLTNILVEYSLPIAWDITNKVQLNSTVLPNTGSSYVTTIHFSADGLILYANETYDKRIISYTLSAPWSTTTIILKQLLSFSLVNTGTPDSIFFNTDGTKLFARSSTVVYQLALSTPWLLSSATYDGINKDLYISGYAGPFFDSVWNDNGTKIYTPCNQSTYISILQTNVTTPWDLTTAATSATVVNLSYKTLCLLFNGDYSKLYTSLMDTNEYRTHNISPHLKEQIVPKITGTNPVIPSAINTATLKTKRAISNLVTQDISETDFSGIKNLEVIYELQNICSPKTTLTELVSKVPLNNGDRLSIVTGDNFNDLLCTNVVSTDIPGTTIPLVLPTPSVYSTLVLDPGNLPTGIHMSQDGTKLYIAIRENLCQVNLSIPHNITTETSSTRILLYPGGSINGVHISDDGTKLYLGIMNTVKCYALVTPWEIASLVYLNSFTISTTSVMPFFRLSKDGTKLQYNWNYGYGFREMSLTVPWDVTTAVNEVNLGYAATQYFSLCGYVFNNTGTKFFAYYQNKILQYACATPYSIIGASILSGKDVTCPTSNAGIALGNNDTLLLLQNGNSIVGYNIDELNDYTKYTHDISALNITEIPTLVYKKDSNISFDFGNGYVTTNTRIDEVLGLNPLLVKSKYGPIAAEGRTLKTKVSLGNKNDKVSKIYAEIQRLNVI